MNRFSVGKWTLTGLLLLVVGSASAQVSKHGNAYLFRMKYTKGQTFKYVMKMTGQMNAQAFAMTMPMTEKVTAVSPAGVATMTMAMGDMAMTVNGKAMNQKMPANMQKVTVEIDSTGHAKGGVGQQNTSVALPEKPIPVGGTWTAKTNAPTGMGQPMEVAATYTLTGFEKVGGFNTAKISVTMSGTGAMTISGKGFLWLNMADGSMVKNTTKMSMTMGAMAMPMDMSITRK